MPDRVHSGSAGLRDRSNIELMINRRINGFDGYGIPQILNDIDGQGRGLQAKASYSMLLSRKTSNSAASPSHQRAQQRMLEQPLLVHYSKDFKFTPAKTPEAKK